MSGRLPLLTLAVTLAAGCGSSAAPRRDAATRAKTAAAAPAAVRAPAGQPAASRPSAADWPMFGRTPARPSSTARSIGISAAQAPGLRRQTVALPGTVDSAPIFLHGVTAGGAKRDVFVMTTSYGRTVAVDAKSGALVWTFTPPGYDRLVGSYRIMNATPVASPDRRWIYAGSPDGKVHKITLAGGREAAGWPVAITRLPEREKVTPSFGWMHGRVVAGTGGYIGDQPPYQGHLVTIAPSGRIAGVFNSLCADRHVLIVPSSCRASDSAFWSRSGAVQMPDGSLLFATGNGPYDGKTNFGDSVVRVSGDGRRLLGSWTPANADALERTDADLGSTGPVLIGGGSILQSGKDAKLHVFAASRLRRRGSVGRERQTLPSPGGAMFTAPAVWRHGGRTYVFTATNGATAAFEQRRGKLRRLWQNGTAGTSPLVAGGLLYVYDPGGALVVYRPLSGRRIARLPAAGGHWNSPAPGIGVIAVPEGNANDHRAVGTLSLYRP